MAFFEVRDKYYKEFSTGMACQASLHKDLNFNYRAHWHNEIELTLVCEGSIGMGINSDFVVLKKNDIAICTSGCIHYYEASQSSSMIIIVFRPELIKSIISIPANTTFIYPFLNEDSLKILGIKPETMDSIRSCFYKIYNEQIAKEGHYQPLIKSYLVQIMGLLLRHIPRCYVNPNVNYKGALKHVEKVQKAIQYIEENYTENITLEEISQQIGLSPFYMSKIFKIAYRPDF